MSTTDTKRTALLTTEDLAALNSARRILEQLRKNAWSASYTADRDPRPCDYGYLAGYAKRAEGAIFDVMNVSRSFCHEPIPDHVMYLRSPAAPEDSGGREGDAA